MASTYSPKLRLELIGAGEQAGLWGTTTNKNIGQLLEQAIAGVTTVELDGLSGNYTLTALDGAPDQSRSAVIKCTYSSVAASGTINLIIPTQTKLYVVRNDCGQTVYVKTSAQTGGVELLDGESTLVFCDGTDAIPGIQTASVGTLTVSGGGTGVTTFTAGFVKSPGGTGSLTSSATVDLTSEVTGTLPVARGGTGSSTLTSGRLLIGNGTGNVAVLGGTITGQVATWDNSAQTWTASTSSSGVTSFSTGSTGLTPSGTNTGAITLGGTLGVSYGGTGATSASGARTSLGLGTMATQNSSSVSITGGSISGVSGVPTTSGSNTWTGSNTYNSGTLWVKTSADGGTAELLCQSYKMASGYSMFYASSAVSIACASTTVAKFLITGGANTMYLDASAQAGVAYSSSGNFVGIGFSGGVFWALYSGTYIESSVADVRKPGGGTFNATSDLRLKDNVATYTKGLAEINNLRPVTYNYNDVTDLGKNTKYETFTGLVAQEVQETGLANMVSTDNDGYLSLNASELTYTLVNAVKELSAQVEALKAEVAALKGA